MANTQIDGACQHLCRTLLQDGAEPTDAQLLTDYLGCRDEASLATVVHRHGPMVWGVCRRVLGNHHAAEDAFQAVFLVLVRKAASVAPRERLANWLYGVAHQTALKARATAAKRNEREKQVTEMPESVTAESNVWPDLQPLLDEELSRLPDRYRAVIVLCDLEDRTRAEAARQLGVPEGSVAGWLARGRALLAKRLTRRGVTLSAAALAAVLSRSASSAGVPPSVSASTIRAASLHAADPAATTGVISVNVAALTEGVLRAMFVTKLKIATAVLLVALLAGSSVGFHALDSKAAEPTAPGRAAQPPEKTAPRQADPPTPTKQTEKASAPLPEGAVAGLGFGKFRAGGATDVVFSPDGKYLAAKSSSDIIHVWDVKTGRSIRKFTLESRRPMKFGKHGLSPDVSRFCFSADGKALVAYENALDRAWQRNIETGEKEKLPGDLSTRKLYALQYSADGKALVVIHEDLTVRLHDPKSGKETLQVAKLLDRDSCATVTFSKNGQWLLLPKYDDAAGKAVIDVIDVKTGKAIRTLEASTKYGIKHVTTTADGSKVFAIDLTDIHAWDVATGKDINDFSRRIGFPVDSFAISPDDKTLVVLHGYNVVFWDLVGSKLIRRVRVGIGHRSLAIAPDGKTLAVGSGQSVKFLDMATGDLLHKNGGHESRITAVALSPDGKFAFTVASDRQVVDWKSPFITLRRWDARTGAELKVDTLDDTDHSFELIFSRDAKKLAFRRYQPLGKIDDFQIWNTADGSLAHKIKGKWPWKLAFDVPGRHLAVILLNGSFELYDAEKGTELRTFPGSVNTTTAPAFSPDGKTVAVWRSRGHRATLVEGGDIHFFDTESGKERLKIAFESGVSDLRYTPDGRILAISARDTIHLWDVGTQKLLREIKAGGAPFAFSEDSKFLATGNRYGAVETWSVENGKRVGHHEGHNDRISSIAFSPDGARLITGSEDGIAIIWDFAKLTAGGSPSPK